MTQITLAGCEPRTLLSHMALYGLAAILESEGTRDVRLSWTPSGNPRPVVSVPGIDDIGVATLVGRHARSRKSEGSWIQQNLPVDAKPRGLMSPRLSQFDGPGAWAQVQNSRHAVLNELTAERRWLDLRFLAALGEPCYWSRDKNGKISQDDGASRLEMQPRNTGAEFVGSRLRKLVTAVAARSPEQILSGLRGQGVEDESEGNKADSFTATGLAALGPTDNALAWCALWGISQFPIAMRANAVADTTGHVSGRRKEWFYVPVWQRPWRPARVRTVLASRFLRIFATTGLELNQFTEADVAASRAWLAARDVDGVMRFPVHNFGTGKASQRRAMRGEPLPVRSSA